MTQPIAIFDEPVGVWQLSDKDYYPKINNTVIVDHPRRGIYDVRVTIPCEFYMVLEKLGVNRVYTFCLQGKTFSMETDKGTFTLWVFKNYPKWINQ